MSDTDTLTKYGSSFQHKCLAGILSDKQFFEQILDIVKEDFFELDAYKWILNTIIKYYYEFKSLPTLDVFKHKLDDVENDVLKESIISHLRSVHTKLGEEDLNYVKKEFLEFCRNQSLKSAILESVDLLKSGKYEEIKASVDQALKAGMERDTGHEYMVEIDERLSEDCRNTIKTNWPIIDNLLDGGLGSGELGCFVGGAGIGKSWLLNRVGTEALKQGKNVVHITLELQQKYVGRRYDCCFTGIDFQNITKNKQLVEDCLSGVSGWLQIKYFPVKTISPMSIKNYVERLQTLTGEKVDLLIVDYADLLKSSTTDKNSNSYLDGGSIYEELRGVAGELDLSCWTASQANRGASNEEFVEADGVADSYKKIMTADVVISVSRQQPDKIANTARFQLIKNRFGADGIRFVSSFDASCGNIKIYDIGSDEAKTLKAKIKDGEKAGKNRLQGLWKTMKDDSDDDLG